MSLPVPTLLRDRWLSGKMVGAARPWLEVQVRRGHLTRQYVGAGNDWRATWVGDTPWKVLPNIAQIALEQSFDNNGVAVATINADNIAYVARTGPGGGYHTIERGWFSPFRAYKPPMRPSLGLVPNEWDQMLATAAQVMVYQGYGNSFVQTFTGLIDQTSLTTKPDKITLTCRDFGALLLDQDVFGWNMDPRFHDPLHFWDAGLNQGLLSSGDAAKVDTGRRRQKSWVLIGDISELVTTALKWAGFPAGQWKIAKVGARLKEPIAFQASDTLYSIIKKACDLSGYNFFIRAPTADAPLGFPVFQRSRAAVANPPVVTEIRDDQLLTGLQWQTDNTKKAAIIRVRGKPTPRDRGGRPLGHETETRIMSVYRPPWHRQPGTPLTPTQDRDARVLRHVIHEEPLYDTQQQVDVAAMMIALAQALGATTATIEIPAYPALQLDDVVGLRDLATGITTRAWIAHLTTTQTSGKTGTWKQSLGVAQLDSLDVVQVVSDLRLALN